MPHTPIPIQQVKAAPGRQGPTTSTRPFDDVPDVIRRRMSRIRAKDSKPELAVRRLAHRLGYRFRLHRRSLPGSPDLVFPGRGKVIFVHGCFWHQHQGCRHASLPRTRPEYWLPKLARNVERDGEARAQLEALGWGVEVLWECETTDANALTHRLRAFLEPSSTDEGDSCRVRQEDE